MISNSLQDNIAITAAATPEHLCATCWRVQPCAPSPNDFEAMVAFRGCTTTGPRAPRTAGLLCTDARWRRVTATLIGDI